MAAGDVEVMGVIMVDSSKTSVPVLTGAYDNMGLIFGKMEVKFPIKTRNFATQAVKPSRRRACRLD
ncbi:hypothetical protein D3C72_2584560 [compost metagenome]